MEKRVQKREAPRLMNRGFRQGWLNQGPTNHLRVVQHFFFCLLSSSSSVFFFFLNTNGRHLCRPATARSQYNLMDLQLAERSHQCVKKGQNNNFNGVKIPDLPEGTTGKTPSKWFKLTLSVKTRGHPSVYPLLIDGRGRLAFSIPTVSQPVPSLNNKQGIENNGSKCRW